MDESESKTSKHIKSPHFLDENQNAQKIAELLNFYLPLKYGSGLMEGKQNVVM